MIKLPGIKPVLSDIDKHILERLLPAGSYETVLKLDSSRLGKWKFRDTLLRDVTVEKRPNGSMLVILNTPKTIENVYFTLRPEEAETWPSVVVTLLEARITIRERREQLGWCQSITYKLPDARRSPARDYIRRIQSLP